MKAAQKHYLDSLKRLEQQLADFAMSTEKYPEFLNATMLMIETVAKRRKQFLVQVAEKEILTDPNLRKERAKLFQLKEPLAE